MHKIDDQVIYLSPNELKASPDNFGIHADIDALGRDSWLFDSIKEYGVIAPCLIFPDKTIHDGHRRWAGSKKAKLAKIPCIVLHTTDKAAAFSAAQLARQQGVFAKCVMYRATIEDLIKRGKEQSERNLTTGADRGDADSVQQEWIRTEEVLGVSRRVLSDGVNLLAYLGELAKHADPAERQRAGRGLQTFRNRGLMPARRMMGVIVPNPKKSRSQKELNDDDDTDADCTEGWADEPITAPPKRKKKAAPAAVPALKVAETPDDSPTWSETASGLLANARAVMETNGVDAVAMTVGFNTLFDAIQARVDNTEKKIAA